MKRHTLIIFFFYTKLVVYEKVRLDFSNLCSTIVIPVLITFPHHLDLGTIVWFDLKSSITSLSLT